MSRREVKERVLQAIGRAGLHQESPSEKGARFRSLGIHQWLVWDVTWEDNGVNHDVHIPGMSLADGGMTLVSWTASIQEHEERIYKILCEGIQALESSEPAAPVHAPAD